MIAVWSPLFFFNLFCLLLSLSGVPSSSLPLVISLSPFIPLQLSVSSLTPLSSLLFRHSSYPSARLLPIIHSDRKGYSEHSGAPADRERRVECLLKPRCYTLFTSRQSDWKHGSAASSTTNVRILSLELPQVPKSGECSDDTQGLSLHLFFISPLSCSVMQVSPFISFI